MDVLGLFGGGASGSPPPDLPLEGGDEGGMMQLDEQAHRVQQFKMEQHIMAATAAADADGYTLMESNQAVTYNEQHYPAPAHAPLPPLLDPFSYDAPCSPLPPVSALGVHDEQAYGGASGSSSLLDALMPALKQEHHQLLDHHHTDVLNVLSPQQQQLQNPLDSVFGAPLSRASPVPVQFVGGSVSNAQLAPRQNVSPSAPMVQSRSAAASAHYNVAVKYEPMSPSSSTQLTSPLSRVSSPHANMRQPTVMQQSPSSSPLLTHLHHPRSGSSAGDSGSGSAGSGAGSGANSAAHSCDSNSDDASDSEASFDDEEPAPKKARANNKAATAASTAAGSAKKGRKRKSKAGSGSGNSSSVEGNSAAPSVTLTDATMLDAAGAAAAAAGGASGLLPGEVPVENKRQQRLQRNRASAQLSRERKKQYQRLLEKQLAEMAEVNDSLVGQVRALTEENTTLKARLAALNMRERVAQRYGANSAAMAAAAAASNRGGYAASQASTASLSAHHRTGSDADSLGSNPTSPLSGGSSGGDFDLPSAKRLRVAAYNNNNAPGAPASPAPSSAASSSSGSGSRGGGVRAGMLLFTLVMSVGLLVNSLGGGVVDVGQQPVASFDATGAGVTAPTITSGGPAASVVASAAAVLAHAAMPSSRAGRVLASVSSHGGGGDPIEDAYALVPLSGNSKGGATVELIEEGADDSKALDVYSRLASSSSSSSSSEHSELVAHDSSANQLLDASARAAFMGCKNPSPADVQLLHRLLLSTTTGNATTGMPSATAAAPEQQASSAPQYLFAPNSLGISHETWTELLFKHNLVNVTKSGGEDVSSAADGVALVSGSKRTRGGGRKAGGRLRKVIGLPALPAPGEQGLPSPSSSQQQTISIAAGADSSLLLPDLAALPTLQSGLQVGDKLLLWVPLTLSPSATTADGQLPNATTAMGGQQQGVVEIACSIAHVRPIVLA